MDRARSAKGRAVLRRTGRVSLRPVLRTGAEEAIPSSAMPKELRYFQLTEAADEDRFLQGPVVEVWRTGAADRTAGIGLGDVGNARREEHQPSVALRVLYHPGIAHRAVVPVTGRVFLVELDPTIAIPESIFVHLRWTGRLQHATD